MDIDGYTIGKLRAGNTEWDFKFRLWNEKYQNPQKVKIQEDVLEADYGFCSLKARLTLLGRGVFAVETVWTFYSDGKWRFSSGLSSDLTKATLFIPGVLYRGNNRGEGSYIKTDSITKIRLREDRTPLPGCLCLYTEKKQVFSCLSAPETEFEKRAQLGNTNENLCVCIEKSPESVWFCQSFPATELPYSYEGKNRKVVSKTEPYFETNSCCAKNPEIFRRVQYMYIDSSSAGAKENAMLEGYRNFIEALVNLKIFSEKKGSEKKLSWKHWRSEKLKHLTFLVESSGKDAYIKMGKGNESLQSIYEFTGASFLVKSLEGAAIFARAGKLELAEKIGDFFLQAENPPFSGIFRDNYHLQKHLWGGYLGIAEDQSYRFLVNARCCGEAMISYLSLYKELKKHGIEKTEFLQLPFRVADFFLSCQITEGEFAGCFGRWWKDTREEKNLLGTNGAYIVLLLIALKPYAKKETLPALEQALKKAADYYLKLVDKGDFYGDTLDADAYDKESAAVLLRMFVELYTVSGEARYKAAGIKCANFALTWIWMYNVVFPKNSPLGAETFHSAGMTSVSVAHHHLDFYGMYLARDFLRLHRLTGEKLYRSLAKMMINASRQLMADETHSLGKDPCFTGWQPEQINYTAWDYFDRPDRQKGFFDICIAWVPVLTLGAYDLILQEKLWKFS